LHIALRVRDLGLSQSADASFLPPLGAIESSTDIGLRDRALLGGLAYTFARIGAVVNLKVEDYYPSAKRFLLRFKEKGGKEKELPVHHKRRSAGPVP
jgi:integrase